MSRQSASWLDGTPTTVLPLPDRGVDFGDGLFETILLRAGHPLFLDMHFARLALGLEALAIPDCLAAAQQQIQQVCSTIESACRWAVMRLSVLRSPGPRGYAPAHGLAPRILINITPLERDCDNMLAPATLNQAKIRLSTQPALARIKHLNRLEQIVAATQAQADNVDESFVFDQAGHLVCVIAGNVFLVCQGEVLTPVLDTCGVAGTRRRLIIESWGPSIGLKVREARLTLADLHSADEVFYSNSLITVRPVSSSGELSWQDHSVCNALFNKYREALV
ncbi:Aminodeoxychorismate lyase [Halioglobus japonicus]|nr:Aminodeoxychorismate lyase [Halioglobus japonicus]